MSRRTSVLARERGFDLASLQRGLYVVSMEDLVAALERQPGAFARVRSRVQAPMFAPIARHIRYYQWQAAHALLRRSGFVVAPCGSGKTLIGCLIAALNGGRFLVLTTRYAAQWCETLARFFEPTAHRTRVLLAVGETPALKAGDPFPAAVVSTYAAFATAKYSTLRQLVYDTVILDEAHAAAARTHLALLDSLHCVWACGLTATKVREDDELQKLERRFGPDRVLSVVERAQLIADGFVNAVRILHLLVPFTHMADLERRMGRTAALGLHPHKIQVVLSALRQLAHEGHKTIVFCDDLFALDWVMQIAVANGVACIGQITMKTPQDQRAQQIDAFSRAAPPATLFLSRTGDEALDLPSASAGIVFWHNWKSRRQIVQRLGRLARPHTGAQPVFLVVLLDEPKELERSKHREAFLAEHGFAVESTDQARSAYGAPNLGEGREYIRQLCAAAAAAAVGSK